MAEEYKNHKEFMNAVLEYVDLMEGNSSSVSNMFSKSALDKAGESFVRTGLIQQEQVDELINKFKQKPDLVLTKMAEAVEQNTALRKQASEAEGTNKTKKTKIPSFGNLKSSGKSEERESDKYFNKYLR